MNISTGLYTMTVADLKKWLADKPDDAVITTPHGVFYEPSSVSMKNVWKARPGHKYLEVPDALDNDKPTKAVVFW